MTSLTAQVQAAEAEACTHYPHNLPSVLMAMEICPCGCRHGTWVLYLPLHSLSLALPPCDLLPVSGSPGCEGRTGSRGSMGRGGRGIVRTSYPLDPVELGLSPHHTLLLALKEGSLYPWLLLKTRRLPTLREIRIGYLSKESQNHNNLSL